ncbi:hypothetical protein N0V82_002119 [Gnomoniopsis sp. IMI 355080]|nr:hypothetical protein N0V82_002119 [Gnomoniopsis sp. IMI 355080]
MLTQSSNISLRQWKAVHTALKEWGPLRDPKRHRLLEKTKRSLMKNLMSNGAQSTADSDEPDDLDEQDDAPTCTTFMFKHWQVDGALCVLESSDKLQKYKAQLRTVKIILAEVARLIKRCKDKALHHYSKQIDSPDRNLSTCIETLQPAEFFHFITHLRIVGVQFNFTQQDLDILPGLQNLGVLEVIESWHENLGFCK